MLAIGDEGFPAIDDIFIAVFERCGFDRLQIRAGAGFGHGNGANHFAAGHFRQIFFLLLLRAMSEIMRTNQRMHGLPPAANAETGLLLDQYCLMAIIAAAAAIFFRY